MGLKASIVYVVAIHAATQATTLIRINWRLVIGANLAAWALDYGPVSIKSDSDSSSGK